jgi:hypothetical protein
MIGMLFGRVIIRFRRFDALFLVVGGGRFGDTVCRAYSSGTKLRKG